MENGTRIPPIGRVAVLREVQRDRAPARQRREQAVECILEHRQMAPEPDALSDRLVDHGSPRDDAADQLARIAAICRMRPAPRECAEELTRDRARQRREQRGEPAPSAPYVGSGQDDSGRRDADADLCGAGDGEHEDVAVRPTAGGAQQIGRDDRGGVACERRRVGREVRDQGRDERARGAPQRERDEEGSSVLREQRSQHDDRDGTDDRADHPEPALAEGGTQPRLAGDRRREPGPRGVVELQPEREVVGETDRRPEPQPEQERRPHGTESAAHHPVRCRGERCDVVRDGHH